MMTPKKIPKTEIVFNPSSYVDPNARVFEWEGKVLRAISNTGNKFYDSLFKDQLFIDLQKKWIIKTEMTEYLLDDFAFIVEHERVPFISYCVEWPAIMLKDAAVLTLELCLKLAEHDLSLQDAYPWNVCFNFAQPVFIDIGSIIKAPGGMLWNPYQQFCQFFLYPIYLSSAGYSHLARLFLYDYLNGVDESDLIKLLPLFFKIKNIKIFGRIILPYWLEKTFPDISKKIHKRVFSLAANMMKNMNLMEIRKKFLKGLLSEVEMIKIPIKRTDWYNYYGEDFSYSLDDSSRWNLKQRTVAEILDQLSPATCLDIACNRGWYAMLAANKKSKTIAFDKDENCVSQLYLDAKEKGLEVLPLVLDFLNPTPQFGWNAAQFPSAIERLACDMVFAFALVHHLIFKQFQNFERISKSLKAFTKKWVLVEFPSPEDEKVKGMWNDRCSWYNLENILKALREDFEILAIYDSHPSTRKLILCKLII